MLYEVITIGFENYLKLFTNKMFLKYSWNTLVWTFFSVIGQLVLGLGLAMLINYQTIGVITSYSIHYTKLYDIPVDPAPFQACTECAAVFITQRLKGFHDYLYCFAVGVFYLHIFYQGHIHIVVRNNFV